MGTLGGTRADIITELSKPRLESSAAVVLETAQLKCLCNVHSLFRYAVQSHREASIALGTQATLPS